MASASADVIIGSDGDVTRREVTSRFAHLTGKLPSKVPGEEQLVGRLSRMSN